MQEPVFPTCEAAAQINEPDWSIRYAGDHLGFRRRLAGRRVFSADEINQIRQWLEARKAAKAEAATV